MTEQQIKDIIENYISDAQGGMSKENPKLDFKAKWYDLKVEEDINEFIKDSSAIANTPGLDGFIVIGFDDKKQLFTESDFSQSNLRDSNELVGMLVRRVDRNYTLTCYDVNIYGHKLSVLHIPPSFDKPHVIKNYKKGNKEEQHRVFIRNGSTTRIATKYDLDFIAYDRKNNTPEYSLFLSTSRTSIQPEYFVQNINFKISLIIENNGMRPVAITEIILMFNLYQEQMIFISQNNDEERFNPQVSVSNLIIQPFEIKSFTALSFISEKKLTNSEFGSYKAIYNNFESIRASIKLNNNKVLETNVQLIN